MLGYSPPTLPLPPSVYDERRKQSLELLEATHNKQARVLEVLCDIDKRLKELEEEMHELTEYQELDRKKRSIEFAMCKQDSDKLSLRMSNLEIEQQEIMRQVRENERRRE